ncbi:hypothetical protein OQA88_11547 [Cercophora sp. LCS_1]
MAAGSEPNDKGIEVPPSHEAPALLPAATQSTTHSNTSAKATGLRGFRMLQRTTSSSCKSLQELHRIVLNRWWLWELASLALSALAMMGVVITLIKINDTALTDWAFPIQPNSLISVFMTVSKSALLVALAECIGQSKWFEFRRGPRRLSSLQEFDEASRGPWGSAQLLLSPGVAGWIAWAGAFLTVVSLALDPFTQQILAYLSREVPSNSGFAQVMTTQFVKSIDKATLQGAILGSIYAPKQSYLTYNCTTSTCTWTRPVVSLGVCAACRDLTSLTMPECTTSPGPLFPSDGEEWNFSTTTCNYSITPETTFQVYIQTLTLPAADGRPTEYANQYTQLKVKNYHTRSDLGPLINPNVTFAQTILSYSTQFDKEIRHMPSLTINDLAPEILACGVYFCAQSYTNLAVRNGSLTNFLPSTSVPLSYMVDNTGKPTLTQTDSGVAEILAINTTDSSIFPGNNTGFLINQNARFNLLGTLRETFTAIFNLTQSSGNDAFSVFPEPNSGMDGLLKTAYKNMSAAFDHVAGGITGQMRITLGSEGALGSALADETFVRVRWGWMVLPLGVLGCTAGLLVGTIWRDRGRGVWKSNCLALCMHPLKGCEGGQVADLEGLDGFARGVRVQLVEEGSGFAFVGVKETASAPK